MNPANDPGSEGNFGRAWVFLCLAFCAHVADEALTGFLPIYNATVLAMRSQYKWFPMPTFGFREWLAGLIVAYLVFLLLTPFAFRNACWLRPLAYFYAGVHFLNGMGHSLATFPGRTCRSWESPKPITNSRNNLQKDTACRGVSSFPTWKRC